MDAAERLGPADVAVASLTSIEHRQRYAWASSLSRGRRVLDLCCGIGYGTLMLAEEAETVHGIDFSADAIATARSTAPEGGNVTFEQADALDVLRGGLRERFDTIVCFEGIEHLPELSVVTERLADFTAAGGRVLLSVPNSKTFGEVNPFHLSDFDYHSAMAFFGHFPGGRALTQFVAEGTLITSVDPAEWPDSAQLVMMERAEVAYANNFLLAVNVDADELAGAEAALRAEVSPYYNRELQARARANEELWETNRRLGRLLDELRLAEPVDVPAEAAFRSGRPSAAMALSSFNRERPLHAERAEEVERLRAEVVALQEERGQAWHRYNQLRARKVVKFGLKLTSLGRG